MIQELDTRYGTMYVPDTDNGQYWWLKTIQASPEDYFIEMICGILDCLPKGTALDVGANFGCWTLPLSKHVNKVLAFEPQRCVFDVLQKTVLANDFPNIELFNKAVGAKAGVIGVPDINMDESTNFGGVSMGIPHSEHPLVPFYDIEVIALDDLILKSEHISFIKADVEGAEVEVLTGAQQTIRRCKPILFVEAFHSRTDTEKLRELISSFGYSVEEQADNFLGVPL